MKTQRFLAVLLPLAALALSPLSAQTPTDTTTRPHRGPGGPGGHGRGNPIVRAIDSDKNREISSSELAGATTAILTLDANKDGAVTVDELRPARPADAPARPAPPADAPARRRPSDPVMLALDADSDGNLSAGEITRAAASLAALDANKDGKLTADEFHPLPPETR